MGRSRELRIGTGNWRAEKGVGEQNRELGEELPHPHLETLCSAPGPAQGQTDRWTDGHTTGAAGAPCYPSKLADFGGNSGIGNTRQSPAPASLQAGGEGVGQFPNPVCTSGRGHGALPGNGREQGARGVRDERG